MINFAVGINKDNMVRSILSAILLAISSVAMSQSSLDVNILNINTSDGLSQNTVRTILVDRQGFVWAGTLGGLDRFDGTRVLSHKPILGQKSSLSDPRIREVHEDLFGKLWVKKYDNTFSCYDTRLEKFVSPVDLDGDEIELDFSHMYSGPDSSTYLYGGVNGAVKIKHVDGNPTVVWRDSLYVYNDITTDMDGVVWLAGDRLTRLSVNESSQMFDVGSCIKSVTASGGSIFIVADSDKLYMFNTSGHQPISSFQLDYKETMLVCRRADDNTILLTTSRRGLLSFDISRGVFVTAQQMGIDNITHEAQILSDNKGHLWVRDHTGMLYQYIEGERRFKSIRIMPYDVARRVDEERFVIFIDSKGRHWITTYGYGLVMYDDKTGEMKTMRNNGTPDGLPSDYLLTITEDAYGNMWVGSEYDGLVKLSQSRFEMSRLMPEPESVNPMSNSVRTVYEDVCGNVWMGTKAGCLYVYDMTLTKRLFTRQNINPYTIAHDNEGRIWVGTKGDGVYVFDRSTYREIAHFVSDGRKTSLCHNSIFNIMCDRHGYVWIASFGGGLDKVVEFDGQNTLFEHYFNAKGEREYLRYVMEAHDGRMWLASNNRLISFDPDELLKNPSKYRVYPYDIDDADGISCKDIKTICEDSHNNIWVGTAGGGLNKLVERDGRTIFEKVTTANGLPSDIITSLICTNDTTMWIGTENGIVRFNTKDNNLSNIQIRGGVHCNYCSENAAARRRNGDLIWGTLEGMVLFGPERVLVSRKSPEPILTDFYIDGNRVQPAVDGSPLEQTISQTQELTLSHKQNTITLSFASLNMTNSGVDKYTYILKGFEKQWSQPSTVNSVTYKNLPCGEYTFMVKNDGDNDRCVTRLKIKIVPPFWLSVPAYILYALLAIVALTFAFYIVGHINRLSSSIAMERELTDYKLRFFTNISHEFRTPLTLIKGSVDSLSDSKDDMTDSMKTQLELLSRNTGKLSRLIDQLLEFRKIQNKVVTLNLEETDIGSYVKDIFESFVELADKKNIAYSLSVPEGEWRILVDRNKVEKIIYNYLSNAFKFTQDGGKIEVSVKKLDNGNCHISVADNGCGVPSNRKQLLFKRFMQANYSSVGTGVGLSLVKEFAEAHHGKVSHADNAGGGSVFSVELPVDYSRYADVNIIKAPVVADIREEDIEAAASDSKYTVLVVDDNSDIVTLLQTRLSPSYNVMSAQNGKEALDAMQHQMPDIIVSDVKMPVMDGIELTQRVRSDLSKSHLPIILLTAHPSDSLQLESSESGADYYIMKPFDFKLLLSRIEKLIEQREMLKDKFSKVGEDDNGTGEASCDMEDGIVLKNFMEDLNAVIESNASRADFGLDDLVGELHIGRSTIYKRLKAAADCTPGEYVKVWRLNKAKALLLRGDLSVAQVSAMVGIEDPFYFSKCFKRQFGVSPSKIGK